MMSPSIEHRVHAFSNGATLPYRLISLVGESVGPAEALYFHGYGEGDKSTEAVLQSSFDSTNISLTGVKIDFSDLTNKSAFENRLHAVESIGREVVPAVMQEFSDEHSILPITIGHSMGALEIGLGLDETGGEYTGDILSVNGMGFTVDTEMDRVYRNRLAFLGHYGHALLAGTNPFKEKLGSHAIASAIRSIGKDAFASGTFPAQLTMANSTDILPAYYQHAQRGNRVLLLSGDRDKLFRTKKAQENLALYDLIDSHGVVPDTLEFEVIPRLGHQDAGMSATRNALDHGLLALTSR